MNPVIIERIAKACHEINRSYCESLGDNSQPSWEEAPAWQKDSSINGVKFHLDNPEATPESSHRNWLEQKLKEGWKFGIVKNVEAKEHPCCVDYNDLPASQKAKDYIFRATVRVLKSIFEN